MRKSLSYASMSDLVATISVSRYEMKYTRTLRISTAFCTHFFQRLFLSSIGMEVSQMKLGVCQRLDRSNFRLTIKWLISVSPLMTWYIHHTLLRYYAI